MHSLVLLLIFYKIASSFPWFRLHMCNFYYVQYIPFSTVLFSMSVIMYTASSFFIFLIHLDDMIFGFNSIYAIYYIYWLVFLALFLQIMEKSNLSRYILHFFWSKLIRPLSHLTPVPFLLYFVFISVLKIYWEHLATLGYSFYV